MTHAAYSPEERAAHGISEGLIRLSVGLETTDDILGDLDFALAHDGPAAIRYPKAPAVTLDRAAAPIELGRAEVLRRGADATIVACGAILPAALAAAERLDGEGLEVGVINARFVKPLDADTMLRAVRQCPVVLTVEEGCLMGGFGSAVLEAACDAGVDTSRIRRLGLPDRFIEHGERGELLADLGLDTEGICRAVRAARAQRGPLAVSSASIRAAATRP
jgi:1-deoxy-D-xylulose-5-phosphate synthase